MLPPVGQETKKHSGIFSQRQISVGEKNVNYYTGAMCLLSSCEQAQIKPIFKKCCCNNNKKKKYKNMNNKNNNKNNNKWLKNISAYDRRWTEDVNYMSSGMSFKL